MVGKSQSPRTFGKHDKGQQFGMAFSQTLNSEFLISARLEESSLDVGRSSLLPPRQSTRTGATGATRETKATGEGKKTDEVSAGRGTPEKWPPKQ